MPTSNLSLITNNSSLIEGLLQTIESLNSMVVGLRDELELLRKKETENAAERKRLMALIEAKDGDIRRLTDRMSDLLGKVDALTKALEDKSHQLTNRNRGQSDTMTKA